MEEREISSAEVQIAKVQIEAARKSHAVAEGNKTIRWIFGCAAAAFSVYIRRNDSRWPRMRSIIVGYEPASGGLGQSHNCRCITAVNRNTTTPNGEKRSDNPNNG